MMAYIGQFNSLINTPNIEVSGLLAWMAWRTAYLTRLGSWKNKFQVPFDWLRSLIFGRDVTTF
jgi:NADH:ubiquinone reductase (non-electrogenic)